MDSGSNLLPPPIAMAAAAPLNPDFLPRLLFGQGNRSGNFPTAKLCAA